MTASFTDLPAPTASFPALERLASACPSCGVRGLLAFYDVAPIPVNSCILLADAVQARGYPRGELRLGFCPACGFIANTEFDIARLEYSDRYEETQAFSGTFNAFARGLAQRLVDRYDLRGKTVLEIGCGKGEFLVLLCELGGNAGVGIDPGYRPERTRSPAADRIRFIRDLYSERYADVEADFICCRHTLEHLAPTRELIRSLRRSIGDRADTTVFFEIPDVLRILEDGAFWDLYYEHCSYFTPGSLARLFRSCGFEVLELERDYADQYVLLTARPADGPTAPRLPLEDDLATVSAAVWRFREVCAQRLEGWRTALSQAAERGRRVVIWGSGSKGVAFLTTLGAPAAAIEYVVDINPHKHGRFMAGTGQEIVAPEFLRRYRPDEVIVMNPIYMGEIRRDLARLGIEAEVRSV